jgi:hypothetical protein
MARTLLPENLVKDQDFLSEQEYNTLYNQHLTEYHDEFGWYLDSNRGKILSTVVYTHDFFYDAGARNRYLYNINYEPTSNQPMFLENGHSLCLVGYKLIVSLGSNIQSESELINIEDGNNGNVLYSINNPSNTNTKLEDYTVNTDFDPLIPISVFVGRRRLNKPILRLYFRKIKP